MSFVSRRALPPRVKVSIIKKPDNLQVFPEIIFGFRLRQENLEVVKGDIFDVESLVPIIEGKNAVLSCLGFHKGTIFSPTTLYSKSITPITSAMER